MPYNVFPGSVRHQAYTKKWEAEGQPNSFTAKTGGIAFEVERTATNHIVEVTMASKPPPAPGGGGSAK